MLGGIAGGVRKSKSKMPASLFQLLQPVQLVMYYKDNNQLNRIKEVKPIAVFLNIHTHPVKRTLLIFYAELLQKSLKEMENNNELFDFLIKELIELDVCLDNLRYHHLNFMIDLSSYLGFLPNDDYSKVNAFFNLADGNFQKVYDPRHSLHPEESILLHSILEEKRKGVVLTLNKKERAEMLQILLKYYRWHVPDFGEMKSPEILHSVLS